MLEMRFDATSNGEMVGEIWEIIDERNHRQVVAATLAVDPATAMVVRAAKKALLHSARVDGFEIAQESYTRRFIDRFSVAMN